MHLAAEALHLAAHGRYALHLAAPGLSFLLCQWLPCWFVQQDGAWDNLHDKEYKPKGVVENVEATGLRMYRVGKSNKCIIMNYTIFGFDGGRIKQMADFFADHGKTNMIKLEAYISLTKVLAEVSFFGIFLQVIWQ